jgi:exonuclease SbcC
MSKVKIDKAKQDYFIYTELTNAFGKDGIPLLVIENALAELQSEVQKQLEIMTDGAVMVEFRTQKELKSGKMSDTLDILVSDREGIRDFNLYSGGERMRVALAIRLGLSKLLSRRAGKRFDILIIDEISDLDIHGMGKFVELIHQVAQDYKQIFVVSHIDELKDRFQQVIQVVKDKNGSKVFM